MLATAVTFKVGSLWRRGVKMFCSTLPKVAKVDGLADWKARTLEASWPTGQVGRKWRLWMPLDL